MGKWSDCRFGQGAYGGLWTENIVSAIARDLLAGAMLRLEAAGYPMVLTVHDEVVVEVPDGFGSLDEFRRLIVATPDWADGILPIAAKVREAGVSASRMRQHLKPRPSGRRRRNGQSRKHLRPNRSRRHQCRLRIRRL